MFLKDMRFVSHHPAHHSQHLFVMIKLKSTIHSPSSVKAEIPVEELSRVKVIDKAFVLLPALVHLYVSRSSSPGTSILCSQVLEFQRSVLGESESVMIKLAGKFLLLPAMSPAYSLNRWRSQIGVS